MCLTWGYKILSTLLYCMTASALRLCCCLIRLIFWSWINLSWDHSKYTAGRKEKERMRGGNWFVEDLQVLCLTSNEATSQTPLPLVSLFLKEIAKLQRKRYSCRKVKAIQILVVFSRACIKRYLPYCFGYIFSAFIGATFYFILGISRIIWNEADPEFRSTDFKPWTGDECK